jgi:hypothetical protein
MNNFIMLRIQLRDEDQAADVRIRLKRGGRTSGSKSAFQSADD